MSADACQPEWFVAAYADGELDASGARRVETHLVSCERCRRRVLALREEARELGRALRASAPNRAAENAHAADADGTVTASMDGTGTGAAPAREAFAPALALGLPLSIAAVAAIGLFASAALGQRLPAFLDWLHPARIMGVNNMFWNLLFWLRDESRGLLDLAVGIGAVTALATLGSFLLNALVRRQAALPRRRFTSVSVLALALALTLGAGALAPSPASAALDWRDAEGEDIRIPEGERVDGLLVVNGESVSVEGRVLGDAVVLAEHVQVSGVIEGNLIALGRDVEVTGTVAGDVIAAGEDVEVAGEIAGDLFLAASEVEIASAVAGSLFAAARDITHDAQIAASAFTASQDLHFGEGGSVARDFAVFSENAVIAGAVGRDLAARAAELVLAGEVTRDAALHGQKIALSDGARVGGAVTVRAPADAFALADGARVTGGVTHTKIGAHRTRAYEHFTNTNFYWLRVIWLTCEFCVGLLLFWLAPGLFRFRVTSGGDFFLSLATGFASLPLVLVSCALLAVTVVGIPLALLTALLYVMAAVLAFLAVAGRARAFADAPTRRELARIRPRAARGFAAHHAARELAIPRPRRVVGRAVLRPRLAAAPRPRNLATPPRPQHRMTERMQHARAKASAAAADGDHAVNHNATLRRARGRRVRWFFAALAALMVLYFGTLCVSRASDWLMPFFSFAVSDGVSAGNPNHLDADDCATNPRVRSACRRPRGFLRR